MKARQGLRGRIPVEVGFAADEHGTGVAYARLGTGPVQRVLRVPFRVKRCPGLREREVGYAALLAVTASLRRHGFDRVALSVDDECLAADVREHRDVPAPLALAYVRLRCALNQFSECEIAARPAADNDLRARARCEVALHAAA